MKNLLKPIIYFICIGSFPIIAHAKNTDDFCPPVSLVKTLTLERAIVAHENKTADQLSHDKYLWQINSEVFSYHNEEWQVVLYREFPTVQSPSEALKQATEFYKTTKFFEPYNFSNILCEYSQGSSEYSILSAKLEVINNTD